METQQQKGQALHEVIKAIEYYKSLDDKEEADVRLDQTVSRFQNEFQISAPDLKKWLANEDKARMYEENLRTDVAGRFRMQLVRGCMRYYAAELRRLNQPITRKQLHDFYEQKAVVFRSDFQELTRATPEYIEQIIEEENLEC
ncbi:(P)ppGpp synthetase I, SpoT/RelA [Candida maltosa Xu316]|uniref:(P)ppGpp synthetase I, SpoT/RelA n=1 Tax=Candida maltosa (strain Xu316) TaxID=1245528 RepID=M3JSH0_CANMX|nr:(P)ppGpp synthetase I, SpoT/RelA [Candida maltosa Xu316]